MAWVFDRGNRFLREHRDAWDRLNKATVNHILLDSKFVGPLVEHFSSKKPLLFAFDDEDPPAMALLQKGRNGFWATFQPSQAPLGLILVPKSSTIDAKMRELIRQIPGYALGLSVLQQDPDYSELARLGESRTIELVQYIRTARLVLTGTFQEYWQSRPRDLVVNLARHRRRLQKESIRVEMVVDRDTDRMADCVKEHGILESKGWKGKFGTAVAPDNEQGLFYRKVLENFSREGEAVFYRLKFDGMTVASNLCLERSGVMVNLKIAYDEDFKRFAPGFLLKEEMLKTLFSEGRIRILESYGGVRKGWTTKWFTELRTMYHVNFYRYAWVRTCRRLLKAVSSRPKRSSDSG